MIDKYYLFGNPVSQSLSPKIHKEFARQTHQDILYEAKQLQLGNFKHEIEVYTKQFDFKGCNITAPFKEEAYLLADELTQYAQCAKSVNTIKKINDRLIGENTDGFGLVADLLHKNINISEHKILILGAGGAVRGILKPLIDQKPKCIHIHNRTLSKVDKLIMDFSSFYNIEHAKYNDYTLVINGISSSLNNIEYSLNTELLTAIQIAYDLNYKLSDITQFNKMLLNVRKDARCFDGLGMLLYQAKQAFVFWRGVEPDVSNVMDIIEDMKCK